jgi:hypothetical protein
MNKAIKNGTAKPCFCVDLVRAQDELGFSDALAGYVSGSLLEAGSDTTAATLVGCKPFLSPYPTIPIPTALLNSRLTSPQSCKPWSYSPPSQRQRRRNWIACAVSRLSYSHHTVLY